MRHYSRSPRRGCLNVELDRSARRIELRSERLSIELDPTSLELSVAARDGAPRLSGARPRAWLGGRVRSALRAQSVESERVDTPLGPATRVLVCCDAGQGLQLGLSLDVGGDWPGVVLQLALQNAGSAHARLDALDTLAWRDSDGELELPGPARELRWLDPGAHGGIPARAVPLRRGLRAECVASLAARGHAGLTLGFLGWRLHAGRIELEARAGAPVELAVRSESGITLAPGERAPGERLWLGIDAADADGLAVWAERVALELEVGRRRPVSVWCTGPAASASGALELARELRQRELPVDVIRVDGGFSRRAGDWLDPTPAFPTGLGPLARELRELGFALGVRLAPFAVARGSEPARAQRDWLLPGSVRTAAGRVRVLDAAREPVLAWLESLARALAERGAEHLWLDDLWLGLLPRGRPRRAGIYRRALEALRRGAGPQAFLTGLGAPFAASTGLLDALQLSPEGSQPARWWRARSGDPALRAGLAGRLAIAELAPIPLAGDSPSALRSAAIQTAICGGNVVLCGLSGSAADPLGRLALRLLPPSGLAPRRLVRLPGAAIATAQDGSHLLALFEPARGELDLSGFDASGSIHVFDAWRGLDLGLCPGSLAASDLEPATAQLLRISPVDEQARLIGSTLHLTAGAAELREFRAGPGGSVHVELVLPGRRQGSLYIRHPGGGSRAMRTRVAFEDALQLETSAGLIRPTD